jgi:hypothetical protein
MRKSQDTQRNKPNNSKYLSPTSSRAKALPVTQLTEEQIGEVKAAMKDFLDVISPSKKTPKSTGKHSKNVSNVHDYRSIDEKAQTY